MMMKIRDAFRKERKYPTIPRRAIIRWTEDALRDNTGAKEIDVFLEDISFTMPFLGYEHARSLEESLGAPVMDLTSNRNRPEDDIVGVLHPDALPIARF